MAIFMTPTSYDHHAFNKTIVGTRMWPIFLINIKLNYINQRGNKSPGKEIEVAWARDVKTEAICRKD